MKSKKVQDLINEIVKLTAGKTLPMWKVIERAEQRRDAIWEDIFNEEINNNKGEIKYKYTDLNCAKTAAEALRFGVGKIQV